MTVANMPREGAEYAANKPMKTGHGQGTKKGLREGYLGAANSSAIGSSTGYGQVSAGTPGPNTGTGKNTVGVMATAPAPKGRKAATTIKS